jgi:ketosteroid isomerase-like protein
MDMSSGVPTSGDISKVVIGFTDAANAHDVTAVMKYLTPDTVFENTAPAPDGTRYEGAAAVRAFWEEFFRDAQDQHIEVEDIYSAGNRCTMRWRYTWRGLDGKEGHVRGLSDYTIRAGLIAAHLAYVKG